MRNINTGETAGIIRRIDDLGRITLPKEFRKQLDTPANGEFEMFLLEDGIYLKKVN